MVTASAATAAQLKGGGGRGRRSAQAGAAEDAWAQRGFAAATHAPWGGGTAAQSRPGDALVHAAREPIIRLVGTRGKPNLLMKDGCKWHLFLSHSTPR